MDSKSVVHKGSCPNEHEFHNALTIGLTRAQRQFKHVKEFAQILGLTPAGLKKITDGGMTNPKRLFDALAIDDSILDDICALYGRKLVPADSAEEESAAPPLVAALHKIIDAEKDGIKRHTELLDMDDELAAAEKTIGGLRNRIREIRKPTRIEELAL